MFASGEIAVSFKIEFTVHTCAADETTPHAHVVESDGLCIIEVGLFLQGGLVDHVETCETSGYILSLERVT